MNKLHLTISIFSLALLSAACNSNPQNSKYEKTTQEVMVTSETTPVLSAQDEDAADDPSIYINPEDPSKSWIIGTNKKSGLVVYSLNGEQLFFEAVGLVNNVDLRQGFTLSDGSKVAILAASNRSDNSITVLKINYQDACFDSILTTPIQSNVDEVYGCCMYHSPNDKFYAFVNGKNGNIEQWELKPDSAAQISAEMVHSYKVNSQPEGMVADDANGYLYVGEEDVGIWRFELFTNNAPVLIAESDTSNANIAYDIEGLTLFYGKKPNTGYLLASSQGNNSYAVFERMPPNEYIGSFKVISNGNIDGSEETDGIDVLNANLNDTFPNGLFIAQDGYNYNADSTITTQNFKMVSWKDIAESFTPNLIVQ